MKIKEIFKPIGKPSITYVERDKGQFENQLKASILSDGQVCLLTGSSKTGKTTLYKKVIDDLNLSEILIRCNDELTVTEFWKKALEQIDFSQIIQKTDSKFQEISAEGKLGWKWLAGLIGEIKLGIKERHSESEIREIITSQPSPEHLVPFLKSTQTLLVVEDFHYLSEKVKKSLFQIWKIFIDNEISVLIIGTTNHAVDLAFANKDLIGRISHIQLPPWSTSDLITISQKGFKYLGLSIPNTRYKKIALESMGLPIITQQICLQIFIDKGIHYKKEISQPFEVKIPDMNKAMENLAQSNYSQFKDLYEILSTGIRKSKSKYNTYELMLLVFSLDPIKFNLSKGEIIERIVKIKEDNNVPPISSINTTLANLKKHQSNKEIELLEWMPKQQKLFMVEPSFLFYLRWKEGDKSNQTKSILDVYNRHFNESYKLMDKLKEYNKLLSEISVKFG